MADLTGELGLPDVLRGIALLVGSVWEWEPLKPHARVTVRVTEVTWNGEACWVKSQVTGECLCLLYLHATCPAPATCNCSLHRCGEARNSLDRWVEATVLVSPKQDGAP